jgi:hypothetical protein
VLLLWFIILSIGDIPLSPPCVRVLYARVMSAVVCAVRIYKVWCVVRHEVAV